MNKQNGKNKSLVLRDNELTNSGVGKLLLADKERLQQEVDVLKKSLKENQDQLEDLRTRNHELDKANSIFALRLNTAFLPEFLKFIASSVGAGLSVNFFFSKQMVLAIVVLVISVVIYGGILFLYRK